MQGELNPNLRLLAPIAVAVFAIAMVAVLLGSGLVFGGGSAEPQSVSEERRGERSEDRKRSRERSRGASTYTVQVGDTLESIASDNDVSIDRLQELNPQIDPQALTAGQRIKLRE